MNKLFLLFVIAVYSVEAYTLEGANRIIGGTYRSNINYVISLQEKQATPTDDRGHKCGGVLITRQNALTAASCVLNNNEQLINITNFRVFAGTVLTNDNADNVRDIASITPHPEFNRQTLVNDIAIITLQAAFPEAINPLPMPTAALPQPYTQPCESSGFGGRNATSTASAQLITIAPVAAVSSQECSQVLPQLSLVPSMVCGMAVGGGCAGDIGNPLVCNTQSTPVLEGLLSRSNNCELGLPEVFTRVYSFAPWVNQVLRGAASTSQLGTTVAFMFVVIQCFKIFH